MAHLCQDLWGAHLQLLLGVGVALGVVGPSPVGFWMAKPLTPLLTVLGGFLWNTN